MQCLPPELRSGSNRDSATDGLLVSGSGLVVSVKFSNSALVSGDRGDEPPVSVAAVAARRVDHLQFLEVELCDGVQLLRQSRALETGGQVVEPNAVFVLQGGQSR